jgi:5-methylcytosine-specific restriction endonuclease McrA
MSTLVIAMSDSLYVTTFLAAICLLIGVIYYRKRYKEYKKKYYQTINPSHTKSDSWEDKTKNERERWLYIRSQILLRDDFRCQECGYYKHLEVHHIIPRSKGGNDEPENLITLCQRCHSKKHGFKNRENKRKKHARRNARKREQRWLNKNKGKLKEAPFIEDFQHHPEPASLERRQSLYRKWQNDELNQTK